MKHVFTNVRGIIITSVEPQNGDTHGSRHVMVADVLKTTEKTENIHIGIRAAPPK